MCVCFMSATSQTHTDWWVDLRCCHRHAKNLCHAPYRHRHCWCRNQTAAEAVNFIRDACTKPLDCGAAPRPCKDDEYWWSDTGELNFMTLCSTILYGNGIYFKNWFMGAPKRWSQYITVPSSSSYNSCSVKITHVKKFSGAWAPPPR